MKKLKIILKKLSFCGFLLLFLVQPLIAQLKITGKVTDINKVSLVGANILAFPEDKGKLVYSISDDNGNFTLLLSPKTNYNLSISFIGYITKKEKLVTPKKDSITNYILQEDPNKLEEIVIKYKVPVKIRKDTTTYEVDAFTNGKERKLKQVLKKLPGVEVDRKGNVTVKGKKVTTLLVDNKKFFTGDTKLAVNNIPADVINQIEVLEDYHENPFMKGLDKSEEVAMNIKLKKDKKKFLFGDIEAGLGFKDRYVFHPALFKYSPTVNYSFIGDYNNTNRKSFTISDYINFQGGVDAENITEIFRSPVIQLLRNQNFIESTHQFGGLNMQWSTNKKVNWSTFLIALSDKTSSRLENTRKYLIDDINEFFVEQEQNAQDLILGKLQLLYIPKENTRIQFDNKLELTNINQQIENQRNINTEITDFNTLNGIENQKFNSFFKMEKKFSTNHTSQGKASFEFEKTSDNNRWLSAENIFPNSLDLKDSNNYDIFQNTNSENLMGDISFKHFWIINNLNHLYINFGNELFRKKYNGNLFQRNDDFSENILTNFSNDLRFNQNIFFTGLIYKRLVGDALFSFELKYQNYLRSANQFNEIKEYISKRILPKVEFEWEIDTRKKLTIKYNLTNRFPSSNRLLINNILNDYNTIYTGNIDLEETFYHYFSIQFRRYKTYGWSYYPSLSYRIRENPIQNIFNPTNIFSVTNPVNLNTPNKSFNSGVRVVYNYKYWKLTFSTDYTNSSYASGINTNEIISNDNSLSNSIKFRTVFEEKPNIDFSYRNRYNDNRNDFFNSIASTNELDIAIDFENGNFVYKTEFQYNDYQNQTTENSNFFNELDASIFYQKEDSPWGFELLGTNITNNSSKLNAGLSAILFSETRRFVFPRTIMLKIIYKL